MDLTQLLKKLSTQPYDRQSGLGLEQDVFETLSDFKSTLEELVPAGYSVRVSRGVGNLPVGLWVAVLNEEVTTTPTEGLYLVYLFDETRQHVSLSLNQGVTAARKRARDLSLKRNELLREEASELRKLVTVNETDNLTADIQLGAGDTLGAYKAGNVYAKVWPLDDLPEESEFRATFELLLDMYEEAVEKKEEELIRRPGKFKTPARGGTESSKQKEAVFAPKSSEDYVVAVGDYKEPQVRTRAHERLVKEFGEFEKSRGLVPATSHHPIDLTLESGGLETLVEAKVLHHQHPSVGIRESIGQLFEYRRFLRPDAPETPLVAVYNERPSDAFIDLLEGLGIASCWKIDSGFDGSSTAVDLGLVE